MLASLMESEGQVKQIEKAQVQTGRLCEAGMKVVAQLFLQQVTTQPEKPRQWEFLARLALRHQAETSRERLKAQENAIRQGQLELAREKWAYEFRQRERKREQEYDEMEEEAVQNDLALAPQDEFQWNRRKNLSRYNLVGEGISPEDILPESIAEAEAMKAARALPPETGRAERQRIAAQTLNRLRAEDEKLELRRQQLEEEIRADVRQRRKTVEQDMAERDAQAKAELEEYARRPEEEKKKAASTKNEDLAPGFECVPSDPYRPSARSRYLTRPLYPPPL